MILVTGATGLLGNCIVRELLQRGEAVRVLCRKNTPRTAIEDLSNANTHASSSHVMVDVHEGDLSKAEVIDRAVEGCSAVIHSAAMIHIGWQFLAESREVNVEGTRRIVNACIKHAAKMVHISTVDTMFAATGAQRPIDESDPRPSSVASESEFALGLKKMACAYVISKTEAEQVVRDATHSGLQATIVHPGFMLGPYDWKPSSGRMMLEISKAPILLAPAGGCSACDARDVAAATVNAIDRGANGQSYILAGENLTYQQLWSLMLNAIGKRKTVRVAGRKFLETVGKVIDTANRGLRLKERDLNGAMIGMGNLFHYYDSTKALQALGYQRRPIETTVHDAWNWLKK
ncbi:MAG: SDR family oxidoreductase [Pirellulaceae bacterium]|nr:SDR family oxidoreductase [Pirellulaceae bacterium]